MVSHDYISPRKVRQALRSVYRNDVESNFQKALLASLSDGIKGIDDKGRWKPSPVLILFVVLAFALAGVFLYFSLGGQS